MTAHQGLLQNRALLIVVLLTCLYASGVSWLSTTKRVVPTERPVPLFIFCLAGVIFITASIAYRSKLREDKIVFGAYGGALALAMVKAIVPLGLRAILALNAAKSFLWTIAALVSLIFLVRVLRASRGNGS
jgi:hypothetical protein